MIEICFKTNFCLKRLKVSSQPGRRDVQFEVTSARTSGIGKRFWRLSSVVLHFNFHFLICSNKRSQNPSPYGMMAVDIPFKFVVKLFQSLLKTALPSPTNK